MGILITNLFIFIYYQIPHSIHISKLQRYKRKYNGQISHSENIVASICGRQKHSAQFRAQFNRDLHKQGQQVTEGFLLRLLRLLYLVYQHFVYRTIKALAWRLCDLI